MATGEQIYKAIQNKKLDPMRLNEEHKKLVKEYVASKSSVTPATPKAQDETTERSGNPLKRAIEWYESTPAGKFNARVSETALDVLSGRGPNKDRESTGNKIADAAATGVGFIGGLMANPGGAAQGIGGATMRVGEVGKIAATKAVAGRATPKVVQKIAPLAGQGALAGGLFEAGAATVQGEDAKEIAKRSLIGMAAGAVLDPAIEAAAIPLIKAAVGKIGSSLRNRANVGSLAKIEVPAPEVSVPAKELPSFSGAKPQRNNAALTKAVNEYNNAIETIQNHFKTNQLRAGEQAAIKSELGIDVEALIRNIENAESTPQLGQIAERSRLARAAGVTTAPGRLAKPSNLTPRSITPPPLATTADDAAKMSAATGNNVATVRSTSQGAMPKTRPDPDIPAGLKERGVSENIRTDINRPDAIRDSLSKDPLVYEQLANKETLQKAQDVMAQGVEKARGELDLLIRDMKPEAAPLAKIIADEYVRVGNIDAAREVISSAAVKATQAGQFGQAFRILRESADPTAVLSTVDKLLKDLNTKGMAQYGAKWTNVDLTAAEKTMIQNLPKGDEAAFNNALEQIGDRIAKSGIIPTTNMEKFDAWRRIAMLLNPKTHVRNIVGNVLMMGLRKPSDTLAAGIEASVNAFRKARGQAPIQRTKAIGWSADKALVNAVEAEWQAAKKDLLQVGRWDIENFNFLNREKRIFDTKWLEWTSQKSKDLLNMGDAPFVQRAYKDALGQFMSSNKLTAATDEARAYAKRRAFEATYKQANQLSEIIQGLKRKGGPVGTLFEGAIPFVRTPANLLYRAAEYSPVGLMKALYTKGKTPTVVIEELAKGLTGSGVAALGFMLADMGWARYERSKSKNVDAILNQMGEQSNAIITPLGSYTFDWAQPIAVPFAMGIAAHEGLQKNNEGAIDAVKNAALAGVDTIFNLSMLRNIKDIMGGAYGSTAEAIASIPASYLEQALPTLGGQIARTIDPVRRSTYDTSDVGQFKREQFAKIPGLSKKLEPRLDVFGREQEQGGALQQFLNPGYWKAKSDDPTTQEIVRLYRATGDTAILPKVAPTKFTRNKVEYKLTPPQLTQFQREVGQENYNDIKKWLDAHPNATDDQKARALKGIVQDNDDWIKDKFVKELKKPPLAK